MPAAALSPDLLGSEPDLRPANDFARVGRCWLLLAMLSWAAATWLFVAPHGIGYSWRECDTQAIARNLAFEEFDPLRPRIDWRGDGPGYVETELQLYPTLVALATTTEPGASRARADRNSADGFATGLSPVPVISKTPSSFVDPKRFLIARRIR